MRYPDNRCETTRPPLDLQDLVAPMSKERFLTEFWARQFIHIPGEKGRFAELFPWERLNEVLQEHELFYPRLRLVHNGIDINPQDYATTDRSRSTTQLKIRNFLESISKGATLVIDGAERVYAPLRNLTVRLEHLFRVPIVVNLYAGWRTDNGFKLHWDEQDVFILQVAGRKHWRVYQPTRPYPLKDEVDQASLPGEPPVWDGTLGTGELLYIPRGWWHIVFPINEPTLHLTVTVAGWRGMHLLNWFVSQLKSKIPARMDLPHLAVATERNEYVASLRRLIQEEWTPDVMTRFLEAMDAQGRPRPYLNLPQIERPIAITDPEMPFALAVRGLALHNSNDTLTIAANSKSWRVSSALRPAVQMLQDGLAHSLNELLATLDHETVRSDLEQLIADMIGDGVLVQCAERYLLEDHR